MAEDDESTAGLVVLLLLLLLLLLLPLALLRLLLRRCQSLLLSHFLQPPLPVRLILPITLSLPPLCLLVTPPLHHTTAVYQHVGL